jgi:hypothetical protein
MEETSRGVSRRRAARWSRWTVSGPTSQAGGQPRVQLTGDEHGPIGTALPDPATAAGDCGFWNPIDQGPAEWLSDTCSTGLWGEEYVQEFNFARRWSCGSIYFRLIAIRRVVAADRRAPPRYAGSLTGLD